MAVFLAEVFLFDDVEALDAQLGVSHAWPSATMLRLAEGRTLTSALNLQDCPPPPRQTRAGPPRQLRSRHPLLVALMMPPEIDEMFLGILMHLCDWMYAAMRHGANL